MFFLPEPFAGAESAAHRERTTTYFSGARWQRQQSRERRHHRGRARR